MAVYQIYKLLFNRSRQSNFLSVADGKSSYDKAQELLETMLGNKLPITKEQRNKSLEPLENYVERRREGVTVLVLCNNKKYKYREKMEDNNEFEYHPGCRIIIDNRIGVAQIAIERSQSFDDKTDAVRTMLEEALCKLFDEYQLTVEIRAKKRESTFWDAVDEQCITYKDTIKQVVYEFPDPDEVGPVDASQMMYDKLAILQSLSASMNAAKGKFQAFSDKNKTIKLERTCEDIAHMVEMCCHNGYNISVHFKHYGLYRFGKEIKALSQLKDEDINEFITGQTIMGKAPDGEWALIHWLDDVRQMTDSYQDEEPIEKKRKRRNKTASENESYVDSVAESV